MSRMDFAELLQEIWVMSSLVGPNSIMTPFGDGTDITIWS